MGGQTKVSKGRKNRKSPIHLWHQTEHPKQTGRGGCLLTTIVALIAGGCTIFLAYVYLQPKLSWDTESSLDPNRPTLIPIVLRNEGLLRIDNINFVYSIDTLWDRRSSISYSNCLTFEMYREIHSIEPKDHATILFQNGYGATPPIDIGYARLSVTMSFEQSLIPFVVYHRKYSLTAIRTRSNDLRWISNL
jgi:hypothetical protein